MHFHIDSIKVDIVIAGWEKTITIDDRDVLPLRDINLIGDAHKTIDISSCINVPSGVAKIKLPVTVNTMRGAHLSMELPSKVIAVIDNRQFVAEIKNPSFQVIDLTPLTKSANIIPVYDIVADPA